MMSDDIYRVYKSHDAGVEESDRPQLKMSPLEGIVWFARRHAWHLVPKFIGILAIPIVGVPMLFRLPTMLAGSVMQGNETKKDDKPAVVGKQDVLTESVRENVRKAEVAALPDHQETVAEVKPEVAAPRMAEPEKKSVKIVILFEEGVVLDDGQKISVGETFLYENAKETLVCVSVECGIVGFRSGKKVRF
jgi:hypothetical protein